MEIQIGKYKGKNQEPETKYYPILDYKVLMQNPSLLLVREGHMDINDGTIEGKNAEFLEIYNVQFIAACRTEKFENLLAAFYLIEYSELEVYVISGFTGEYYQECERFVIVDYKNYLEIADLTGESKLSFTEYIKEVKSGSLGVNTLLKYKGQSLNFNKQKELWTEIDTLK